MEDKKIKIGFIGCGWIVEHAHIPAFGKIRGVEITAVFDTDIERASKVAKIYNIPGVFKDLYDFFLSGIDAVIVATPNISHVQYSLQALQHGLHVMCEKPIAINSSDVRKLIDTAEKKSRLFIPGFVNRFRYDILKIRELLQENKIGKIVSVQAGWLRRSGMPRPGSWFTNRAFSGGGVLIDLGSHVVDLCLMIIGDKLPLNQVLTTSMQDSKAEQINAQWFNSDYVGGLQIDVEDTAIGRVEFEENILLDIKLSWVSEIDGDCTYFIINGAKGSIKLETLFGFSNDRLWENDSLVIQESNKGAEVIPLDKSKNSTMNAFCDMAKFFADAVRAGNTSYLTSYDGLKTVELIEKLYKSENRVDRKVGSINQEELCLE